MDDAAYLAAIEAAPDDLALRQVYADWLEQHGDPRRAELVRIEATLWAEPVDLLRARQAIPRRRALRRRCDPQWAIQITRPSPAELLRRLDLLARLRPERSGFASDRHGYRPGAPLDEAAIAAVEARLGCALPAQYRRFLGEVGDGGAGPGKGLLPLARVAQSGAITGEFVAPATPADAAALDDPPGALPICDSGQSAYWLVLAGPDAGQVWLQGDDGFTPLVLDEAWGDSSTAGMLASPRAVRLEMIDWYAQWLDERLDMIALSTPDGDEVFRRRPEEVTHVNLRGRVLVAVPEGLRRLTEVRRLELRDNPIVELPPWIGELAHLEELILDVTALERLPEELGALAALSRLSCRKCKQLASLPASLGRLARLGSIWASECALAALPESIGELPLTELDLTDNALAAVPATLARTKLRRLGLARNALATIPDELAGLDQLVHLDLSANPLAVLPAFVARLPRLEYLRLNETPDLDLADACRQLAHAPALRSLAIGSSGRASLPEELGLLRGLERLYVGWNRLTALPASLGTLPRLVGVDAQGNAPAVVARAAELTRDDA